jgi:predicted dehydrogenase
MEKMKIAITGAGMWGRTHAGIFREHPMAESAKTRLPVEVSW